MKKLLATLLPVVSSLLVFGQEKLTFMPAWMPQAQFAGYYVALENGFYAKEGLDVKIEHVGVNSTKPGIQRMKEGEVDIITSHPIQSLIACDTGTPVCNVCQITQNTAMMLVANEPIPSVQSLNHKKIGLWKTGFSEICEICCIANNLEVEWVPFINGIDLFISGAIDATVAMSYNEYNSLVEATGEIPADHVLKFSDNGYDIPEDGLYVTTDYYSTHKAAVDAFCKASKEGWMWCTEHPEEAVDIVMKHVEECGVRTNRYHQALMLQGMIDLLVNPDTGKIDFSPIRKDKYEKLIEFMVNLNYISSPVEYNAFVR